MKPAATPIWPMGSLSRSKPGRHYSPPPLNLAPPVRICAATAREPLDLAHEWRNAAMRPGALDFLRCPSREMG